MAKLSKKNEELLRAVQKQAAKTSVPEAVEQTSAVGLGVDLVEIERMERAIERTPRILERVFTSGEREYAWSKARPAVSYATFFAAREAVLKALGCGFAGINFSDVEITHDAKGKPEVILHGKAAEVAAEQSIVEIQISLSHTHQMAVASAVAIKAQSSPIKVENADPMQELAQQFKLLRTMLDDLEAESLAGEDEPEVGNPQDEATVGLEGSSSTDEIDQEATKENSDAPEASLSDTIE